MANFGEHERQEGRVEDVFLAIETQNMDFLCSICDSQEFGLQTDEFGNFPIHAAVSTGNLNLIRFIVEGTSCEVDAKNIFGQTALQLAISSGQPSIVAYLLDHDAVQDATNLYGVTGLHLALTTNNYQISKMLLERASSETLSKRNADGDSAISMVCEHGSCELVDLVLRFVGLTAFREERNPNNQKSPLHAAVFGGNANVVRHLITNLCCNVDTIDFKGDTPLHWACDAGHVDIVKVLVGEGNADMNIQDHEGDTPLSIAQMRCHTDIVEYLSDSSGPENEVITFDLPCS